MRFPSGDAGTSAHDPSDRARRTLTAVLLVVLLGVLTWVSRSVASVQAEVLTEPAPVAVDGGTYRFSYVHPDGEPVRWDPCTPIRYVVNLDRAPYRGALADVEEALARVTAVSGHRFEYVGTTDEVPSDERAPVQAERYGSDWAPVLIGWASERDVTHLAGDVVGSAEIFTFGRRAAIVTGSIVLDADTRLRPGFGFGSAWGTVLLHEVAHLVGLGHVDDEGEVMHPGGERNRVSGTVRYGPGDLAGLAAIGLSGGCEDAPAASSFR